MPPPPRIPLLEKQAPSEELPAPIAASKAWWVSLGQVPPSAFRALQEKLERDGTWDPAEQERRGNVSLTRAFHDKLGVGKIALCFCDDMLSSVFRLPWWHEWLPVLTPVFRHCGVRPEQVVRCLLAKLPSGLDIPVHHDTGWWTRWSHRVHVPLRTSAQNLEAGSDADEVFFMVGPRNDDMRRAPFPEGEMVELNNRSKHMVSNQWESGGNEGRVHLIFDWVEEDIVLPVRDIQPGDVLVQARRRLWVDGEPGPPVTPEELGLLGAPTSPAESGQPSPDQGELATQRRRAQAALFGALAAGPLTRAAPCYRERLLLQSVRRFAVGEIPVHRFVRHLATAFTDCPAEQFRHAVTSLLESPLIADVERRATLRDALSVTGPVSSLGVAPLPTPRAGQTAAPGLVVVVGAMKCGTTSLYEYIAQHPQFVRAKGKEPHTLDWKWDALADMELSSGQRELARLVLGGGDDVPEAALKFWHAFHIRELLARPGTFTGEATPSYLLGGTVVAERLRRIAPHAKVIVTTRDPSVRALSHYRMTADRSGTPAQLQRRGNVDGKSFAEVVEQDLAQLSSMGLDAKTTTPADFESRYLADLPMGHGSHSYVGRGLYEPQVELLLDVFPPEQVLLLRLETDLHQGRIHETMDTVFRFLGVPPHRISDTSPRNVRGGGQTSAQANDEENTAVLQKLREFYAPWERRFEALQERLRRYQGAAAE